MEESFNVSEEAKRVIGRMLQVQADRRAGAKELLGEPWFLSKS